MRTKALKILVFILLISCLFTSCSGFGKNNHDAMRPPRPTGERAEIQEAIEKTAGGAFTLEYPQRGDYRSAIIMHDLNGAEGDEVIAFYHLPDNDSQTHVVFIAKVDGKWQAVAKFMSSSPDIDRVCFGDINGDGKQEALIGYGAFSTAINDLKAYMYSGSSTSELSVGVTYSDLIIGKFSNSYNDEILLLSHTTTNAKANAKLISCMKDGNKTVLYTKASVQMNPDVVSFSSGIAGKIDENRLGAVIDGKYSFDDLTTQVIYYDEKTAELKNPLFSADPVKTDITRRSLQLLTTDINSDGFLELPVVTEMQKGKTESADAVLSTVAWSRFSAPDLNVSTVSTMIVNSADGYYFTLPEKWNRLNITGRSDTIKRSLNIYAWDKGIGDLLLTVSVFSENEWQKSGKSSGFTEVFSKDGLIFAANVYNSDNPLSININLARECFKLISVI